MVDFKAIRAQFPILDQEIHGHPLVYLDSAATSQKPQCVIDAESDFYRTINAGVHRGAHELAARSTMAFEDARAKVARLVGANAEEGNEEIVVTAGATAGTESARRRVRQRIAGPWGRGGETFRSQAGRRDRRVQGRAPFRAAAVPGAAYRTGATFKWFDLTEDGRIRSDNRRRGDHRTHQGRGRHPRGQHHGRHHRHRARSSSVRMR